MNQKANEIVRIFTPADMDLFRVILDSLKTCAEENGYTSQIRIEARPGFLSVLEVFPEPDIQEATISTPGKTES